ncbi:MAG: hypothetical protein K6U74_13790 [Firmicutes bacterium]|nr:hypothetical protein [Bacillota bacterium]
MSEGPITSSDRKPAFTRDQIINAADLQRKWRTVVESKLGQMPFLLLFSGTEPKATVLSYDKFEELWRKAEEAPELSLQLELATRVLSMIINTLFYRYCHRKKHLQGVHQPLPFSCGACDAEDDKDRQLSPSLNSLDVLPVRPKRHKAAVLLLCGKRTVGNACKCFVLSIHNMDNQQA